MRTFHGLLVGLTILVAACSGSGTASVTAAPASAVAPATTAPPSAATSAAVSGSPAAGAVDLPAACVEAIKAYLIAVEPIVKDVPWTTAIGTPPEIEAQLANASAGVDPQVCPDMSAAEAHDAWIKIAFDAAPKTLDYIDFIYRP